MLPEWTTCESYIKFTTDYLHRHFKSSPKADGVAMAGEQVKICSGLSEINGLNWPAVLIISVPLSTWKLMCSRPVCLVFICKRALKGQQKIIEIKKTRHFVYIFFLIFYIPRNSHDLKWNHHKTWGMFQFFPKNGALGNHIVRNLRNWDFVEK